MTARAATEVSPAERRAVHAASHPAYRADIDGLRTLAVMPVVLNHVGARGFWGGFVGVDIFYVISGFLITGILVRDLGAGRHSIPEFYRRRVLRIFPSLFVTLAVTTLVCAVAMLPGELVRYARSLAATTLFASNLLFWSESGYFAPASALKPLLHTWSLAIEEQFYILWPLMLAAIGPRRPGALRLAVAAVSLASFALSARTVHGDASTAFYLLPSRAWELGLGALLALAPPLRGRWTAEALALAGLAAILYAIKFYNEGTAFPGPAALLPCAGAALLIATGPAGTLVARGLSLAPMVWVGRISYSLYLWHWPVIVLAGIAFFLPQTAIVMAGQVAVSIALAALSWRFVERPFRVGTSGWRTPRVLAGGLLAMLVSLAVAAALTATGGLPGRFTPAQRTLAAWEELDGDTLYRSGTCFITVARERFRPDLCLRRADPARPTLLFVGDSHGAHLWPGLAGERARWNILQATHAGCKPVIYPAGDADRCDRFMRETLTTRLAEIHPDRLLLAARWRPADAPAVAATLADTALRAAHPVLIGPIPQYATALPRLLVFAERRRDPGLVMRALDPDVLRTDRLLAGVAAQAGVPYVSLVATLCPDGRCLAWGAPGVPLQFDYGHLTAEGSRAVVRRIMPAIDAAR